MLDERSQETKDAMRIAMENDAALRAAVEQLRQEEGTTSAEIKGALFLPQMTNGPKNQELNRKMEEVRARMDRAEIASMSLLEAGPPSSLAETGSRAEQLAESRMERAVEVMNAELASQNHRLERQNMRLQDGLAQAWQ